MNGGKFTKKGHFLGLAHYISKVITHFLWRAVHVKDIVFNFSPPCWQTKWLLYLKIIAIDAKNQQVLLLLRKVGATL